MDRHDRSIWSKKIKREECDQADLGLFLETWSELQKPSRLWLKFCQRRVRTHSRHVQKAQNKEEEEEKEKRERKEKKKKKKKKTKTKTKRQVAPYFQSCKFCYEPTIPYPVGCSTG